jgi:hypothetical protein
VLWYGEVASAPAVLEGWHVPSNDFHCIQALQPSPGALGAILAVIHHDRPAWRRFGRTGSLALRGS